LTFVSQQTTLFSQFTTIIIHVLPTIVIIATNVLQIPLPKFHDGDDTNAHKLQYFSTTLRRKSVSWFTRFETTNLVATWGEVWCAFISRFSDVHNERQAIIALREVKQWKHEIIKDYYDKFLQLCVVIPQ
jgi:hypothetical protein